MNPSDKSLSVKTGTPDSRASEESIERLVGQVYAAAPAVERRRLLEHLMRPLGLLSLLGVANGVFAKIWFRRGWQDFQIRIEDTQIVGADDVIELVKFVHQVSIETIDGIGQFVAASPAIGATAAALLLTTLLARIRQRRAEAPADDKP
jgi:hypothetical protein